MAHQFRGPWIAAALSLAATLCATLRPAPAEAQAGKGIEGEWTLEYQRTVRRLLHGQGSTFDERARLTLRTRGDSVFGEVRVLADAGSDQPAPRPVRGRVRGDSLVLESGPRTDDGWTDALARWIHSNMPAFPRFALVVRGDAMAGTRSVVSPDGGTEQGHSTVTAVRVR